MPAETTGQRETIFLSLKGDNIAVSTGKNFLMVSVTTIFVISIMVLADLGRVGIAGSHFMGSVCAEEGRRSGPGTGEPASSKDITVSGTQTRGMAGRNAELKGSAFTLTSPGTVVRASDSGAGFWIQGNNGSVQRFNTAREAINCNIGPGTYNVYPNLPKNSNSASVTVVIRTTK